MTGLTQKAKKTKKQRKYGRNAKYCERYRATFQREKNKVVKMQRVLERNPTDRNAKSALDRCMNILTGRSKAA